VTETQAKVVDSMCKVRCRVKPGLIESESVVYVPTADGGQEEEVTVSTDQVVDNTLHAAFITRGQGKILVELPRESASGRWRVWVPEERIVR